MRSGNGRHRRPRQAPAIVVAAGVTGSALALPLLAAGSASAADEATWDRVAECESGGLWSADFGNGLYGGLQFTQETWDTYGGTRYAARPDLASRAQQIAVAEKALAAQGAKTWATCAAIVGLNDDGTLRTPADPSTGVLPTTPADPSASPDANANQDGEGEGPEGSRGDETSGTPGKSLTPDANGQPGGQSDDGGTPAIPVTPTEDHATPAGPGTGKHRGEAASEDPSEPGNSSESGRHAAPGDDATRGADRPILGETVDTGADETKGVNDGKPDTSGEYIVQPGDNLSLIAAEHELDGGWRALYKANKETVGDDPDLILPGQNLELTDRQE